MHTNWRKNFTDAMPKPGHNAGRSKLHKLQLNSEGFSKFSQFVLDTLLLYIHILIIQINYFQGDLSDISAKMATLQLSFLSIERQCCRFSRNPV